MDFDDDLKVQVKSLSGVLSSLDSIYGLDDEHLELLDYCNESSRHSNNKKYKVGFLFCLSELGLEESEAAFKKEFGNHFDVLKLRIGTISGSLLSLTIEVVSSKPILIVHTIFEMLLKSFDGSVGKEFSDPKVDLIESERSE